MNGESPISAEIIQPELEKWFISKESRIDGYIRELKQNAIAISLLMNEFPPMTQFSGSKAIHEEYMDEKGE